VTSVVELRLSNSGTAAFDHDNISPNPSERPVGHPPEPLSSTDDAKPGLFVESQTGVVLGEYAGLDGPYAGGLGGIDQRTEQLESDALSPHLRSDVDRVFDDAGVRAPVGHGGGGDPTEHVPVLDCHVPVIWQPAGVEMSPVRRFGFEGGVTRRDASA
jgi:hypothetical protein